MLQLFQGIFIYSVKERSQGPDSSHYAKKHFIFHLMFTNRHLSKQIGKQTLCLVSCTGGLGQVLGMLNIA